MKYFPVIYTNERITVKTAFIQNTFCEYPSHARNYERNLAFICE